MTGSLVSDDIPETWLPIGGYEHRYEISNLGRHRGLPRQVRYSPNGEERTRLVPGGILVPMRRREGDRWRIKLYKNNTAAHFDLADLVLATFHGPAPTPHHYAQHIDCDLDNCHLANLRWALRDAEEAAA
ncbi:NUMOD4 domain-containing protein [Mycobacterium sp. HNNTM2301]|uniref:NUMOD4 domain-containing protein n=1 Tax=Mycobacterium hainanense TaxID=3289775 RepID=UPI0035A6D421